MVVLTRHTRNWIVEIISYLFVLLFVYAAVSKLLDFENFQVQLGQSPLLSAFAGTISWIVPLSELVIASMLIAPRFRKIGLYAAFTLMVMFTTYIFIILNYSAFVPCSCGGVLEKMGWKEHLVFNLFFVLLVLGGIVLYSKKTGSPFLKHTSLKLTLFLLVGTGSVLSLFFLSEDIMHNRNNFVRRFPPHPAIYDRALDLKINSYYIAGMDEKYIYLGNVTAPLHIKVLDTTFQIIEETEISLSKMDILFRTTSIQIVPPNFFFIDGTVPIIFSGKVKDWKANLRLTKGFFSLAVPVGPETFAIRTRSSKTNEDVLGLLKIGDCPSIELTEDILEKQIDGIFDTDGMLLYNDQLKKVIYTYYYRNQFFVMDANNILTTDFIGNTIDTISQAQIKIDYVSSKKMNKMSAPPLIVNQSTATYGDYLFVHSGLLGKFEPKSTWRRSSVIDVYNLVKNTYAFSFYIPDREGEGLSQFRVYKDKMVCMVGNHIVLYELRDELFRNTKI